VTDDKRAMIAFLRGHGAAEERQRELLADEGPQPAQAIAESLSALNAAQEMGMWPGPRSDRQEQDVERVRRRWIRIQQHARKATAR